MPRMRDQVARRATLPGLCHLHAPPRLRWALPLQRGAHHHQRAPQRLTHEPGPTRRTGRSLHPRTRFIASKIPEARGAGFASNFDLRHHGGHPPALREAGRDPASTQKAGQAFQILAIHPSTSVELRDTLRAACVRPPPPSCRGRGGCWLLPGVMVELPLALLCWSIVARVQAGAGRRRRGGAQGFRSLPTGARRPLERTRTPDGEPAGRYTCGFGTMTGCKTPPSSSIRRSPRCSSAMRPDSSLQWCSSTTPERSS